MSAFYNVVNSFGSFIKNISDIDVVVYSDSSRDILRTYSVSSKVDLPLGTETTFIVVDADGYDMVLADPESLLNNHIRFVSPSTSNNTNIKITGYNKLTGGITIEQPFGESVSTSDTFDIEILDSIFIRPLSSSVVDGRSRSLNTNIRFDMIFKTKEDSNKKRTLTYQDIITSEMCKYGTIPIYAEDLVTQLGNMRVLGLPSFIEITDSESQFVEYLGSVRVSFSMNAFGG